MSMQKWVREYEIEVDDRHLAEIAKFSNVPVAEFMAAITYMCDVGDGKSLYLYYDLKSDSWWWGDYNDGEENQVKYGPVDYSVHETDFRLVED